MAFNAIEFSIVETRTAMSDRIQRQIDQLLDEAEAAVARSDWTAAKDRAQNVLMFDESNADAKAYLAAAEKALAMLGLSAAQQPKASETPVRSDPAAQTKAQEHLDFAVAEFRDMKMQPSLERGPQAQRSIGGVSLTKEGMDEAAGEAVLGLAVAAAEKAWGPRLHAAHALGSLAHGGFSALVSDVDLGLILHDPLDESDGTAIEALVANVTASGVPLADRLSVFWGSRTSLMGKREAGRFPPLDRLDLLRHGRLLHGVDAREGLPAPTQRELVVEAARFALRLVSRYNLRGWVGDPADLLAMGPRAYTKTVLFPVRFLYTARTGEIGRNHDAAAHMVAHHPGPAADLAAAALRWREDPATPEDAAAARLIREGLAPLYLSCLKEHEEQMRTFGEEDLALQLRKLCQDVGAI